MAKQADATPLSDDLLRQVLGDKSSALNLGANGNGAAAGGEEEPGVGNSRHSEGAPNVSTEAEATTEDAENTEETTEETERQQDAVGTFTEEQQAEVDRRIEEATAEFQTKLTEAENRAAELASKGGQIIETGGLHRLLLTDKPQDIDEYHQSFLQAERWAAEHADGYNDQSPDWKEGHVAMSAAEVRKYFTQLKQEHDELVPLARQRLERIKLATPIIKNAHPTIFDPRHEDFKFVQGILAAHPSLRADPTSMMALGDMVAGRKARIAKEKAAKEASGKNGAARTPQRGAAPAKKPGAKAPLPAGAPSATRQQTRKPSNGNGLSGQILQDFIKSPRGSADLEKLIIKGVIGVG